MAEIIKIERYVEIPRYKVCFYLQNSMIANNYSISFLGSVREQWRPLELYCKDNVLILDGPIADSNGVIISAHEAKVNEVADKLQYTIENDVPEFKRKVMRIIQFYQHIENLDYEMADILNIGLKGDTKRRFMQNRHFQVYARIIRLVFEEGPYSSDDELDRRVNEKFDDKNLITSIIKEVAAN